MSLRILYVYFVNLYICNTYTFGFVLIRTCVFPIPCHTHTYIYNTRLNKRLNPYAGAMHLGASLNSAASTASCVSSQAASFDPGFTLGSGGKGWGKVATILHPKMLQNTSHAITAPWVKTFFDLRVPAVFIEPIYRDHMEKNYHLLAAGQSGSSIHQADAHSALFFHLGVFYPLTFSKISLKCLARFGKMLVYYMKIMGFLTRVFLLSVSGVLRFIQYYCLDVPGILSAGDWHSQIEEWLKRC